jgi:hypothetical protein
MTANKPKHSRRRGCLVTVIVLAGLVLLAAGISALTNIGLPQPENSDKLTSLDKARLAEALNIKTSLGKDLWPEWAATTNPIILFNHAYEFLIGFPSQPPAGWEVVPQDSYNGQAYFRRPAVDPQNFAMPVGDRWAASMATKTEADVFLIDTFRSMFPPPLKQIFPYRVFIQPSETQIGGFLHEDFHVFEQAAAPQRLVKAEAAHGSGDLYESTSEAFKSELKQEADLLAQALGAKSDAQAADLVRQFLQVRDNRRNTYHLDQALVDYERWLEWEEGMAKYVEVDSYRLANQTIGYSPVAAMAGDPYFKSYRKFNGRWSQELFQLRNPSGSPETRFYNTGMAESFLLDRLKPDWKNTVMQNGVFLEDLLRQAIAGN